jgi:hypothetical protein
MSFLAGAQKFVANTSKAGLPGYVAQKVNKTIDQEMLTAKMVKDGVFQNRDDPSVCYSKGWMGWSKRKCSDEEKKIVADREGGASSAGSNSSPRAADPRYAPRGGSRKTRAKRSKRSKRTRRR